MGFIAVHLVNITSITIWFMIRKYCNYSLYRVYNGFQNQLITFGGPHCILFPHPDILAPLWLCGRSLTNRLAE